MDTARSALDRARAAWERSQPQLILDEDAEHLAVIHEGFRRLRAMCDPRGHELLDELERLSLLDHTAATVLGTHMRGIISAHDQGTQGTTDSETVSPAAQAGEPPAAGREPTTPTVT